MRQLKELERLSDFSQSESALIRHGVAVAARIGAGDAIAVRGINQDRGRAAIDAEGAHPAHVVPANVGSSADQPTSNAIYVAKTTA